MKDLFGITVMSAILVIVCYNLHELLHKEERTSNMPVEIAPMPKLPEIKESDATPVTKVEPSIDSTELDCLAKNIYHEARGESRKGQIAVAHVTLNRVHSSKFPNTICGVVHQAVYSKWWLEAKGKKVPVRNKCQFSWYCDGKSDEIQLTNSDGIPIVPNVRSWAQSQEIALYTMLGEIPDNTNGATFYYNPHLADPHWKTAFQKTVMVGNHKFMRVP